jgi:hypothetical protein
MKYFTRYVTNIPSTTTLEEIKEYCYRRFGEVIEVSIIRNFEKPHKLFSKQEKFE